jgi:hypothetical protein
MKTKGIVVLLVISMMLAGAIAIAEQNKGAKDMEISGGTKGNVPFPHHEHQDVLKDCNVCHDAFAQEPGIIDKMKADGKLKAKEIMNKKCVKCHKEKEKAGEKTGPTSCSKCHQKS